MDILISQWEIMSNIIHLLHRRAAEHPDRVALRWGGAESITYREFRDKIAYLASGLRELGIQKGDRVLIFAPLSLELYWSMFAVQQLGAIAVFLDSWARRDQLSLCFGIVQPKAMISTERAFQYLQLQFPLTQIQTDQLEALSAKKVVCPIEEVAPDETALVTFTTGSSGTPKGANRTHRFLAKQHEALSIVLPYRGDETDLPIFPIFALNNLASGISTLLPAIDLAAPSERDPEVLAQQIVEGAIASCTLSPSLFLKIGAYGRALPSLERVVTGGAPIGQDHVELFQKIAPQAEILILYGSTEVEPIAHIEAKEMLSHTTQREGVNVGRIVHGLKVKFIRIAKEALLLGEKGWSEWELPPHQPGELLVSGPHVCEGYYNDPEAFHRTKIRDADGTVWHRTGDIAALDEQGYLWFMGRVHNAILRRGRYIFPVGPEALLRQLPFVRQGAYLGLQDPALGEKACAVFSWASQTVPESTAFEKIAALFAQQNIPLDEIRTVEEIPMDPRHQSKVEYSKLREQLL